MTQRDSYEAAIAAAKDKGRREGYGAERPLDLSGEWADEPSGPTVFEAIAAEAGISIEKADPWWNEVLDAYEEAYEAARLIGEYGEHRIGLTYEQINLGGFAYTNWVLAIDGHLFYLGQDAKFVNRVLGRDFAEFLHEAFLRAGITRQGDALLAGDFDRELLRASLAAGIVRALDDIWSARDLDLFAAIESGELQAWSLSAD